MSWSIPFSLLKFPYKSSFQGVVHLVQGLWLLVYHQYWTLTKTTVGYPAVSPSHEHSVVMILQNQSLLHIIDRVDVQVDHQRWAWVVANLVSLGYCDDPSLARGRASSSAAVDNEGRGQLYQNQQRVVQVQPNPQISTHKVPMPLCGNMDHRHLEPQLQQDHEPRYDLQHQIGPGHYHVPSGCKGNADQFALGSSMALEHQQNHRSGINLGHLCGLFCQQGPQTST